MTRITDLRHLPPDDDPDLDIPPAAERQAEFIRLIVRSASCGVPGVDEVSAIRCRRRPNRRQCSGYFVVRLQEVPPELHYRCSKCDDDGVITHWQGTEYDMSGSEPVDDPCRVIVADEEYRELKEIIIIDEGAERIVWGARRSRKGVVLQGGYDDMDELVGYVAAAANHAKNRRQERILDRVFEAMSDAVGTSI